MLSNVRAKLIKRTYAIEYKLMKNCYEIFHFAEGLSNVINTIQTVAKYRIYKTCGLFYSYVPVILTLT